MALPVWITRDYHSRGIMAGQLLTAGIGSIGFTLGATAAYVHLRRRSRWAPTLLRIAVVAALGANAIFIAGGIGRDGLSETFRTSFDSVLLLATLIGLVGVIAHLSAALGGVDGFLFMGAALVQLASLTVVNRPSMMTTARPWFTTHVFAFALSGTFFITGGVAGIAYLLVHRMLRRKPTSTLVGHVASLESLERFGRWMPVIGLPLFTFGILTGFCGVAHRPDIGRAAWYLALSFVFSIVAWGVYAYLSYCAMYRPQIRGRRAATLATYGLGLIVVVFLFRELLSPIHQ